MQTLYAMRLYGVMFCVAIFCAGFLLCGFTVQEKIHCTIYYEDKKLEVTDSVLRNGWWNAQSQKLYKGSDYPDVKHLIEKIRREVEVKAYDGHIIFTPQKTPTPAGHPLYERGNLSRFQVVGQCAGRDLDEQRLYDDIVATLQSGRHANIVANVKQVQPKDADEILARIGLRGGYTTYFEDNPAREHNIALSLSCFNGLVVQNGETVSFNSIVGARSRARGYQEAKIILDGEFVPGVGGGVCQTSTTLFNAVLLAGLRIDRSYNHSLAISYVPIGRDAMVSSAADLRFTNNSGGPIYIEAGTEDATADKYGRAYIRIYGNKTNIKYKARVTCEEAELKEDEIDPARSALTYIEAWNGDKLVHSELVRKSKYKGRKADE